MTTLLAILQGATLVAVVYGVRLPYDCLSSLDLIAYGEEETEETGETEVEILKEGSGRRYVDVLDLEVEDYDPADDDLGEGFFDVLDDDFDSQRELHHD